MAGPAGHTSGLAGQPSTQYDGPAPRLPLRVKPERLGLSTTSPLCTPWLTSSGHPGRSGLGHVWTAPGWQGFSSRLQHWSEQPCVRPLSAAHLAAGHNALRGSGPGHKRAFEDAVAQVGCPDRQIDRLCITCCSPFPTVTSRRMPDATSSHPKRGGLPVAAALRHQGPRDPRELVSERDGRDLRRPPCQQCH